ncbi:hypothetical protein F5878DRAFT_672164 [Lentinula raphanica]|uniref:Tc1-like transposase DDE domain-containing protein n=1 Tax=Lentinula raphanica TaxID=153919 RepID=A0AA38PDK7_9AGAR|nr:hypothetical protein F5878DRAFT_672164 [Lentinula raphanica]
MERGVYCARVLRRLVQAFIADNTVLPINPYGYWKSSMLCDQDLAHELGLYLQELGPKEITAVKVVHYLSREDVKERHGITKTVSERTAQRWLDQMGYRWKHQSKGQYTDGHERPDVVHHRDRVYIPRISKYKERIVGYDNNGDEIALPSGAVGHRLRVILWFHDESIFYAHDRRRKCWYHKDAPPKPYRKGEGASLMVSDFVSAEFGFLRSPDGLESAQRIFRPGKNRDGYFTNADVLSQAEAAAAIVKKHWPDYEHVFIFDNATTHRKRTDDALSARNMPKNPSKSNSNFMFETIVLHPVTKKPLVGPDGRNVKQKIPVPDTVNSKTGERQTMYFPPDHPTHPGLFKGMTEILVKRGWDHNFLTKSVNAKGNATGLLRECPGFKCSDLSPSSTCCIRRILFNEPDFSSVKSLLELSMEKYEIEVLFLPKFHCELNPIEQCWGYAKHIYRLNPKSSKEEALLSNTLAALDSIPLLSIRRFFNHTFRFMDGYEHGLNGRQAAWAARKYRGHQVYPDKLMEEVAKEGPK